MVDSRVTDRKLNRSSVLEHARIVKEYKHVLRIKWDLSQYECYINSEEEQYL